MNNLIANYEIILNNLRNTCGDIDNFSQIRNPKLSNIELVSLNLTAEYMSINIELQLFRCIKGIYLERMIERSVYNKRRRKLFDYTESIRKHTNQMFVEFTAIFIVDSVIALHRKASILGINYMQFVTRMACFILLI